MWDRIATDFQARLLSFRRTNLSAARNLKFDASRFTMKLRNVAKSLAAAMPDDPALQEELFDLLREQDREVRADRWTPQVMSHSRLYWLARELEGFMRCYANHAMHCSVRSSSIKQTAARVLSDSYFVTRGFSILSQQRRFLKASKTLLTLGHFLMRSNCDPHYLTHRGGLLGSRGLDADDG